MLCISTYFDSYFHISPSKYAYPNEYVFIFINIPAHERPDGGKFINRENFGDFLESSGR